MYHGGMRHVVYGTAGHIDHGKTSLVKALTGTDCDRLPEEQERGITIDLGFAHLAAEDVVLVLRPVGYRRRMSGEHPSSQPRRATPLSIFACASCL